uniref:Uncharacterized protein n=1 Tax=Arundo donax TaxID=35708 RepID=A0A0A9ECH8_ARUDO
MGKSEPSHISLFLVAVVVEWLQVHQISCFDVS